MKRDTFLASHLGSSIRLLGKYGVIVDRLFRSLLASHGTIALTTVALLVGAVLDSAGSAVILAQHRRFKDALVTARTTLLTIVNVCVICAEGDRTAERAHRHAAQRFFKDLDLTAKAGNSIISVNLIGKPAAESLPGMPEMIAEFQKNRGNWTDKTVLSQISAIERKYGNYVASLLLFGAIVIHRPGSEAAHGTLYSMMRRIGISQGSPIPKSQEDITTSQNADAALMLFILSFCIHAMIKVVAQEFSMPNLREETEALMAEVLEAYRDVVKDETKST